jgi:hypothetical protein
MRRRRNGRSCLRSMSKVEWTRFLFLIYVSSLSEGRWGYVPQCPTHEAKVELQWGVRAQQVVDTLPDTDEHLRVERLSSKLAVVVSNLTRLNEIALHDPAHGEKRYVRFLNY